MDQVNKLRFLRIPGKSVFAGNDYLSLAEDKRVVDALCEAAREYGVSAMSSRWALGWTEVHAELESELADFFIANEAVVLGAAYLGGLAYFEALCDTSDTAYTYVNSHSNLFAGMRAAGFEIITFPDQDVDGLRGMLRAHTGKPPVIVTDGVYSINGGMAPVTEMLQLAEEFDAELLVDDAHGVFVVGDNGRGVLYRESSLPQRVTLLGSMSKALGCTGGFVAGRGELIKRMRRTAPASGSTLLPTPIAAACRVALAIVRDEPERRRRTHRRAEEMRGILSANGISVASRQSPIVAMEFADGGEAHAASERFATNDILIPYFTYASEPRQNLLRAVARSDYSDEEMARFMKTVCALAERS